LDQRDPTGRGAEENREGGTDRGAALSGPAQRAIDAISSNRNDRDDRRAEHGDDVGLEGGHAHRCAPWGRV